MIQRVEVYVELVNEGVPVWRPTVAFPLRGDVLVLSNEHHDPTTEEWSVLPGSLVTIEQQAVETGSIGVAIKHDEPAQ